MTTRPSQSSTPTTTSTHASGEPEKLHEFDDHPGRGRFNSAFFWVMGGYIDRLMHSHKSIAFADLPPTVVELGAGVGANLRYLPAGVRLIAVEPNPYMHARLRRAARSRSVDLEIRSVVGERIDLPDASADAVISSLVLCSVRDPEAVLGEIRRILRPGGRFSFAEHVAAQRGTPTRWAQRTLRRPWAWIFEGCSCERDLASVIRSAGFAGVDLGTYRIRSPFLPFNTHIAGTAIAQAGPRLDR
ncbi:class I SAM-dependent methyltransferase [Intrasporangium sp. YIM S08009]|uniref:class I SAM-dependent methyltransferase n=1 Tax=Intrasporangium zincisolvens TaxID=3080018 RepID=UPI002B05B794|nr:methyltransferase domain-containing protein [Intrasporangium sp. YIM S08009]